MNNRPIPGETEEDLLRQQEEFLKNKLKPSVKIIKTDHWAPKISNNSSEESQTQIKSTPPVLIGSIIERQTSTPNVNFKHNFSSGFPQAKRRQHDTSTKKESLFSQHRKKIKNENIASNSESIKNIPDRSYILSGKDTNDIHNENVETLTKMSEEEILAEQSKLLQSLDPKIVEFLKSKRKTVETLKSNDDLDVNMDDTKSNIDQIPKEIIDNSDRWIHFDAVETEKLEWMKNIETPKIINKHEAYEARFDFSGWLLPYSEPEISEKNRILYHHGEESGRPGYSLKELFQLSRSNVQQQKILALNTISQILSLHSTGVYDSIIDLPIEQIFFIIRFSLDDNTPSVLNSSIKALHHLFYNQIDEVCLDNLYGFGFGLIQPKITSKTESKTKDEHEINDQELAELDLVKCLARTNILIRIRYIINTVKPTTDTIILCIELLIRLMRDSDEMVTKIYNCDGLFQNIIQYFVPKVHKLENASKFCYNFPLPCAIKLLRISSCRNKKIAEDLIKKFNIMNSLCSYVSNNVENIQGIKIQIESYKLLEVFFQYNLISELFSEIQPFLISSLNYHFQTLNINENSSYTLQTHFSCILNIISAVTIIDYNLTSNFFSILMQCFMKYCTLISQFTDFKCGKLQTISSLLVTFTNIFKSNPIKSDKNIDSLVLSLISSDGFNKITKNICSNSNLLCEYETHIYADNFSSLESAMWKNSEHIVPNLQTNSCLPFLCALSKYVELSNNNELIYKFLHHENINNYLLTLKNTCKYNLTSNWFTKLESQILMNIFKSSVKIQKQLPNLFMFYELSVKCLTIFHVEQKLDINFILKNIVFNKNYYPNEVLLNEMKITEEQSLIFGILNNLEDIYECYNNVLSLNQEQDLFSTNLTLDVKIGNIIPVDWIYYPIVTLYSQQQENEINYTDKQHLIITRCLQWSYLYESYFSDLSSLIKATDRFCRLSCIFLCNNSLFLDNDVHQLLELCFKVLIKPVNLKCINFDDQIQGLNNFQDFYIQLLDQYQGVSYGDKLFANFILVPLIQNQNLKWRKIFWSEYLGVAQTINLNVDEIMIELEEFLNPPETEVSVLKCYRRALVGNLLNRSPLLKYIANYHVENYVQNKCKK